MELDRKIFTVKILFFCYMNISAATILEILNYQSVNFKYKLKNVSYYLRIDNRQNNLLYHKSLTKVEFEHLQFSYVFE